MSKTRFVNQVSEVLKDLEISIREAGHGAGASQQVVVGTYSQEGVHHFNEHFDNETAGLRRTIADAMAGVDDEFSQEGMSAEISESMRAGMIAALASQNPAQYHQRALSSEANIGETQSLESLYVGLGGEVSVAEAGAYSQESFDETELANFAAQNIMYNVLAARQDSFGEAFFPTKVIPASEGGLTITVDRQEVIDSKTHSTTGSLYDVNRVNLIEAFADHEILNRPATELVPYARPDNSADASFVAESDVATVVRQIAGESIETRPLKIGQKLNLLGLSQHPGLIDNGILDNTDQIAPGMRLKNVYLRISDGTTTEVIALPVGSLNRTQFKKSHEGTGREMVLNFITDSLAVGPALKTIEGADTALLKTTLTDANLVASLGFSVNGNAQLDSGTVHVNASPLVIEKVSDDTGEIGLDAGAGKALVDALAALSPAIIGYDLEARRSNTNWRSTGALIDVTPYRESYAIEPGYPISVLTPPDENQNASKIAGMVNAARIRASNNAITTLINYSEMLAAYKDALARGVKIDIVGAGRHLVKPYFFTTTIDVAARVTSISSHERALDTSKVLVDEIRDAAYRMYRESNYGPALDLANSGTNTKAKVIIGCDAVVARHLDIVADPRLLGESMDYEIVQTNDTRVTDKIFMTFTRGRPACEDALSFGVHAYVPELIQRLNVQRNGASSKNDRVVPRSIHIPVLPIMSVLEVQNLKEALTNS